MLIELIDATTSIFAEAVKVCDDTKCSQTLYAWNITDDSYDYVVIDSDEGRPDVVQSPYITRFFVHSAGYEPLPLE